MQIERVTEKDFARLKKLFCEYYSELDCEDDPEEIFDGLVCGDLKSGLISAAAAFDGDMVGFIIYQIDDVINDWCFKDGCGDIRELFVISSFRKSEIGSALVAFAESQLKAEGANCVYLLPTEESEKFFLTLGYADNGEYCAELDNKVFEKVV
ncbi:MAG: GNAT family N-acetyltransferase [Clostridia bacterium]|nr:GNAT family N-acetyltransferase [Clostridia bacterium]